MISIKLVAPVLAAAALAIGHRSPAIVTSAAAERVTAVSATVSLLNSTDVIMEAFRDVACTGYCVACLGGPGHAASRTPPTCPECSEQDAGEGGGWHSACAGADNCSNHQCNVTDDFDALETSNAEPLSAVGDALTRGDQQAFVTLLDQHPERLEIAAERAALQLIACDGEVIAHYPLPAEFLAAAGLR